ncbi:MAG: hypothetical protein RR716_04055 [Christensenellaceae bacterium]
MISRVHAAKHGKEGESIDGTAGNIMYTDFVDFKCCKKDVKLQRKSGYFGYKKYFYTVIKV